MPPFGGSILWSKPSWSFAAALIQSRVIFVNSVSSQCCTSFLYVPAEGSLYSPVSGSLSTTPQREIEGANNRRILRQDIHGENPAGKVPIRKRSERGQTMLSAERWTASRIPTFKSKHQKLFPKCLQFVGGYARMHSNLGASVEGVLLTCQKFGFPTPDGCNHQAFIS
jgi:hypothetical protein